jgi:hypothetical protein
MDNNRAIVVQIGSGNMRIVYLVVGSLVVHHHNGDSCGHCLDSVSLCQSQQLLESQDPSGSMVVEQGRYRS